ncbi:aldo/keto reductase [Thermoanaerobacterium sp. DL9XJH110]|uniref:aldo/keto reductase n=1 Tax=Thermoanaerobacterium sp. DL9XJH110 TaxID=3386643 RepID=UPI003BB75E17
MEYRVLGNTGLKVSRLCFGSLSISPLQANLPLRKGAEVIMAAMELGINFLDTAEFYNNYPYIREALKHSDRPLLVSSKSYAFTYDGMRASVEKARKEMDKDVIEIFMLHEQESRWTLKGHRPALEYLIDAREKGFVKAIGVSTHTVEVVNVAADMDEIDVIHPIINIKGIGIKDGNVNDMMLAVEKAYKNGKGIYGMKCLGGGNLIGIKEKAFRFVLDIPYLHSVAVGMKSIDEVLANTMIFEGKRVPEELEKRLESQKRKLMIEEWCAGCGRCVKHCRFRALTLQKGKAAVNPESCILCGYCAGYCPEFCIKII